MNHCTSVLGKAQSCQAATQPRANQAGRLRLELHGYPPDTEQHRTEVHAIDGSHTNVGEMRSNEETQESRSLSILNIEPHHNHRTPIGGASPQWGELSIACS